MDINQLSEFATNHLLLVTAFFAILTLLIGSEIKRRISGIQDIAPPEATRLLNHENAIMVDMRTDKEYRDGHIVNAIHVPEKSDPRGKLDKYRDRPVIVYCRTGSRSNHLCGQLRKQGFESVYNLKGGVHAWQQAQLPVHKGK